MPWCIFGAPKARVYIGPPGGDGQMHSGAGDPTPLGIRGRLRQRSRPRVLSGVILLGSLILVWAWRHQVTPSSSAVPAQPPSPSADSDEGRVHDANSLREAIIRATKILVYMQDLNHPPQQWAQIPSRSAGVAFELGNEARNLLADAVDEGGTRVERLSWESGPGTDEEWYEPFPGYSLELYLPASRVKLHWEVASGRSLVIMQLDEAGADESSGDPYGQAQRSYLTQERPLLYERLRTLAPPPAYPPEHLGHLLHFDRVVVQYKESQGEYGPRCFLGFVRNLMWWSSQAGGTDLPGSESDATLHFFIRGEERTVEIWGGEMLFTYGGQVFDYNPPRTPARRTLLDGLNALKRGNVTPCPPF